MTDTEIVFRRVLAVGHAVGVAAKLLGRRILSVMKSVFTVTRRHVPKWVAGVLTVCLFIPGPLDELLVLVVIAVMVAFKPVMRADLVSGIKSAWALDIERTSR